MKIGIVGAGRVGFSLGKYFKIKNLDFLGYYSKTKEHALEASEFTNTECYDALDDLVKACDILFLTVNDDSIKDVVEELKRLSLNSKIICHTSGVYTSDIIDIENVFSYSIHPILAFSDKYNSYKLLDEATFTIEGNEKYIDYFKNIFNNLKIIDKSSKMKYHALASLLSNGINGLCYLIDNELNDLGLDFNDFKYLFINNCKNIYNKGYEKSLTGPIERNDLKTIKLHIEALDNDILAIYELLAKQIALMKNRNEILNYLGGIYNDNCK